MLQSPYDWIVPVAAAPFIGSFLGVLAVRLPLGEGVVTGRSRCRSCGRALGPLELIPIVGWIAQAGKCRQCGAEIGWLYPAIELGALAVAIWASLVTDGALLWVTIALGWTLLALIAMDLRTLFLSDWLTLPLVGAGLVVIAWLDTQAIPLHIIAAALGFALVFAVGAIYKRVRLREGIGMGDAKLMAAAGAWTGVAGLGSVLLFGVAFTLLLVLVQSSRGRPVVAESAVPLGAGLAAGLWLVWLYGPLELLNASA